MTRPPLLSGKQIVKGLVRAGYAVVHQRGSHIKLRHERRESVLIVPNHPEVDRWLLRGLLRDAGLTLEQFNKLL